MPGLYVTPDTAKMVRELERLGGFASQAEAIEDAIRFALRAVFDKRTGTAGIRLVDLYEQRMREDAEHD